MEIKDLQPNQGKVDIIVEVIEVSEPREFNKFGKPGKVANAKAKDASGQITISLWNEQVDLVKPGSRIHITNGWVSEWQGEKQLSTGKFGKLELASADESPAATDEGAVLNETPAEPAVQESATSDESLDVEEEQI
jgi:replication factor A1